MASRAQRSFAFLKLPQCKAGPFDKKAFNQHWIGWMTIAVSREAEPALGRRQLHNWILKKIQLGTLQNQVKAAARELPTTRFEAVLHDVPDRISGVTEATLAGRWQEAALSIRQGQQETLTELLPRVEAALNNFMHYQPERATPDLVYYVYRGSLREDMRLRLNTKYSFDNRVRDISFFRQDKTAERISVCGESAGEQEEASD